MLDAPTVLALAIPLGQAAGEGFAMRQTGSARRKRHAEWTFFAVNIPYWMMIALGIFEHQLLRTSPSMFAQAAGTLLGCAGIAVRVAGHYQLAGGFSPYVELSKNHRLVTTGLYRYVRHPMYVGSLLIFAGLPLILKAGTAWLLALIAAVGFLPRIRKEEQMLDEQLPGYQDYALCTWRMLPGVW
jgi:protein-S-isoprenylcysteine O-methyltransferase Ste14